MSIGTHCLGPLQFPGDPRKHQACGPAVNAINSGSVSTPALLHAGKARKFMFEVLLRLPRVAGTWRLFSPGPQNLGRIAAKDEFSNPSRQRRGCVPGMQMRKSGAAAFALSMHRPAAVAGPALPPVPPAGSQSPPAGRQPMPDGRVARRCGEHAVCSPPARPLLRPLQLDGQEQRGPRGCGDGHVRHLPAARQLRPQLVAGLHLLVQLLLQAQVLVLHRLQLGCN